MLWADFQAQRCLPTRAPEVVRHWQRARALGAPQEGPRPEEALERGSALRLRAEGLEPVFACARSVFDRLSSEANNQDYSLLVSDVEGVIVHAAGGGAFAEQARRCRLMEGAHWNETARGTNAIGTAIAENRAVFVRGRAHFARAYHGLVCYAAPIHDAAGRLIAVVDATSYGERADVSMGFAVVAAARAIEELLRVHAYCLAGASVRRTLTRFLDQMACPAVLLEPPGRIARINRAAREAFGGISHNGDVKTLFGLDFSELARVDDASSQQTTLRFNGQQHRLRVEPIESAGQLVGLLALFEPALSGPVGSQLAGWTNQGQAHAPREAFGEFFAEDEALQQALHWAERLAPTDIPVVLLAETGAGKELVAREIHRRSQREGGPFVAINCGSLSPSLLSSELFGYAPGAFSGADPRGRRGYLHAASGGTLFLDEVAEMPLSMQATLLRFLEDGSYQRVGETATQHADVRIVCATCRDLPTMVESGEFRSDLYFRLKGAMVSLPPLRSRTDVLSLARYLLQRIARRRGRDRTPSLAPAVEVVFEQHDWPGNVRELVSALELSLALAGTAPCLELEHLPPDLGRACGAAPRHSRERGAPADEPPLRSLGTVEAVSRNQSLASAQSLTVRRALADAAGNVSLAAKRLGVARSTLYRMMHRHGVTPTDRR